MARFWSQRKRFQFNSTPTQSNAMQPLRPCADKPKDRTLGYPASQFLHHHGAGKESKLQLNIVIYEIVNMYSSDASVREKR